jgi:DsbC/DsbD-like thiol-disulfide interchange protein
MPAVCPSYFAIASVTLLCLNAAAPARSQDSSAWNTDSHAATRLLAGALVNTPNRSFVRAGIEIHLDPGWKTYWRYPGDTGVPPTFDFAGSTNVKSIVVQWPAPESFPDGAGGHSIGYVGDIILPLQVIPADATRSPSVHVKLNYAVCGNLCVPAAANLELTLNGKGAEETVLDKAEQEVPKHEPLGADDGHGLAIKSVQRQADGSGHEHVVVEVAAPQGAPLSLFVEGPTPDWALPLPVQTGAAGLLRRFTFDVDGLPPGAQAKGAALTLTAVSGEDSIEVPAHLD